MDTDEGALCDFLHRFLDDRERGAVQAIASYCALFPTAAGAIRAEYERLVVGDVDGAPQQIGPYRLFERLGQGSFGLVHRAEDTRLARTVALKLLARGGFASDAERASFEREARVASRLEHPGICTVHEIGSDGLWTWIAMRFVPGETLAQRLSRGDGRLPPRVAAELLAKVALALHAAHEAGIVHRDVKPGNIMLGVGDEPVVVDFGLARDLAVDASLGRTGDVIGSPAYMAPEQLDRRIGAVDARTDVWALGVALHECLAGERPFEAPTQAELFDRIRNTDPVPLGPRVPDIGRDLEVVVATALRKEPTRRYQSARAFAEELQRVLRGEPILARPVPRWERAWRWARRNPLVASLLATLLLVFGGGFAGSTTLLARAEANLRDWERLADGRRLDDLQARWERELWPPVPAIVPLYDQCLAAAGDLLARRHEHESALTALRARARPADLHTRELERQRHEGQRGEIQALDQRLAQLQHWHDVEAETRLDDAERPVQRAQIRALIADLQQQRQDLESLAGERLVYEFDDVRAQLQHDALTSLVLGLRRLAGGPGTRAAVTIGSLQRWREFASTLRQRTVDDHAEDWRLATERVARNPRYAGLRLEPQVGLIPLGADRVSTLEEFCETHSGRPPVRGAAGDIVVGEDTAIVFVLLPGGHLRKGAQSKDRAAPNYDPLAEDIEGPVHEVEVEPFLLGKYEITQGQWRQLTGDNPSRYNKGEESGRGSIDDRHPVENVSHLDCAWTLQRRGMQLPTEAQWEYACRAGTATPWAGDRSDLAARANLADQAVCRLWGTDALQIDPDLDDGYATHAPVGSLHPNAFGLCDMLGNVGEWCADPFWLFSIDAADAKAADPRAAAWTNLYVVRGGSCAKKAAASRVSSRARVERTARYEDMGVRPARALDAAK